MVDNNETEGSNPLDVVPTDDLLSALSGRLAKTSTPEAQALAAAIKGYSRALKPGLGEQVGNQEDEFVQAIKEVEIFGKFPQGLTLKGRELVKPQEGRIGFTNFSPTDFKPGEQFSVRTITEWI